MKASPLVIFHKQLGDVLLLEPALAKLAAASGQQVMLATRPAFAPMLSLMDKVCPMPEGIFRRAASVVAFEPNLRACLTAMGTLTSDKRLIVMRQRQLRFWHRFFFPRECEAVRENNFYRAEYFFNVMPGETDMVFRPPRLRTPPKEWLPAGLPAGYVLLHATSAWKRKSWTPQAWAQALNRLHAQGIGPFVLTGGSAEWEREYVQAIQAECAAPLIDLSGRTTLSAYLAVIANARSLLCIDGSSSHIAAALGVPAVTLFGPSHPLHWHLSTKYSAVVDARNFSQETHPPVASIPVEAVVNAFLALPAVPVRT